MQLEIRNELDRYLQGILQDSVFEMDISIDYLNRNINASYEALGSYDLEELEELEPSFTEKLFFHIDASGQDDVTIYKKAGIDRRLFSKIRSNKAYTPSKSTAISLGLSLELSEEAMEDFLESAGYALSRSTRADLIVRFFINHHVYDLLEINDYLAYHNEGLLGGALK